MEFNPSSGLIILENGQLINLNKRNVKKIDK